MRRFRNGALVGVTAAAVALVGCGGDNAPGPAAGGADGCASGSISGQGATFQQNIQQQWISDFGTKCPGAKVNYQGTGSSAGIQQFGAGTTDFAGSDVPMKADEQQAANRRCAGPAIHIPVTAGGIAVVYNLSGLQSLNLSPAVLASIYQGTIKMWDDPKIKADNPGANLPARPISSFHRADGSGTTAVFTEFLDATATGTWKLGHGKTVQWSAGQAAKGSDGVTAGVKQTDGGITYVEVSFAQANQLPTAKVKGATGEFTELNGANVSRAIETGFRVSGTGNDVSGSIDFAKVSGYPVSTVSYVIACQKYADQARASLLKAYLGYAVTDGQANADQLGYAPLPTGVADRAKRAAESLS